MRPRTKLEKAVDKTSRQCPSLTEGQRRWCCNNVLPHRAYWTGATMWCSDCGTITPKRRDKTELANIPDTEVTCPHCGARLKVIQSRQRKVQHQVYYTTLSTLKGYQLQRTYLVTKKSIKGQPAEVEFMEVLQHWVTDQGKMVIRALNKACCGYCRDIWLPDTMSIKKPSNSYYGESYDWYGILYPRYRAISTALRNGFRLVDKVNPIYLVQMVLTRPHAETLIKAGQDNLIQDMYRGRAISKYWPQIKLCLRNKYHVADVSMWIDLIDALKELGDDIHNPRFICPENLRKLHDNKVAQLKRKRAREAKEKAKSRILAAEKDYYKMRHKYFGIIIKGNGLTIAPLESVQEIYDEGEAMHHCVYENSYYTKKESLIMSARDLDGNRLETIEFNLKTKKVMQSRGVCNKHTEYHDQIIKTIKNNIHLITNRTNGKIHP